MKENQIIIENISNLEAYYTEEKFDKIEGLFDVLDKPWKLITQSSKFGLKGAKFFFKVLSTFLITNLIVVLYSFYKTFTHFESNKLVYLVLVIVISLAFTFYAIKKAYQYISLEFFKLLYENLSVLLKSFCSIVVEHIAQNIKKNPNLSKINFSKTLNITNIINDKFDKTPRIIKKGLSILVNRIPFVPFLSEHYEEFTKSNNKEISEKIYNKADGFINNFLTENLKTDWYFKAIILNVLILFLLVYFKIA